MAIPVLMALEKSGYALPNNCRAGACGEWAVKVTSGQFDQGMVFDMALSQDERKPKALASSCMKPDLEELSLSGALKMPSRNYFPA